jgi:hypothetical protein
MGGKHYGGGDACAHDQHHCLLPPDPAPCLFGAQKVVRAGKVVSS